MGVLHSRLRALGAVPRRFGDVDGLSFGRDDSIDPAGKPALELHVTSQLDQVTVSDERFAASPIASTLQQIVGDDGPALLDTGRWASSSGST